MWLRQPPCSVALQKKHIKRRSPPWKMGQISCVLDAALPPALLWRTSSSLKKQETIFLSRELLDKERTQKKVQCLVPNKQIPSTRRQIMNKISMTEIHPSPHPLPTQGGE